MSDLISRRAAIDALWDALYEYEDKTKKQFQESEDLDVEDWIEHRIFVQNMNDIDRQVILNMPSAQPDLQEYLVWFGIGETLVDVSKMHVTAEEGIEKIRSYLVQMKKPERKVATWKRIDYKPCGHDYECSSCGWKNDMETHFCPNCGARMEGEEDHDGFQKTL